MKKSVTAVIAGMVVCACFPISAAAANRKAQQMVASMAKEQATLLAKFPALSQVDNIIRSDCAAKSKGKLATGDFCGCASAVTMSLWRSGMDPKMMPRLNEYLRDPTTSRAAAFLQYQGPELYRGICTEASKR
jgi:hypothetical protein